MTVLNVDGDACLVREQVYRVADRLNVALFVVSNGSRPVRPTGRHQPWRAAHGGDSATLGGQESGHALGTTW